MLNVGKTLTLGADPAAVRNLTLNGVIFGAGGLTVNAPGGTVTLGGAVANTFSGTTSVTAGTLVLNKSGSVLALGGTLAIGNAVSPGAAGSAVVQLNNSSQTGSGTNVSVFSDGLFSLGSAQTPIGTLTMTGGEIRLGTGTLVLGGDVSVNADGAGSKMTAMFLANNLNLNTGTRNFIVADGAAPYDLDVQAGFFNGALVKSGAGTLRLAGETSIGFAVTLNAGTLALASNTALGVNSALNANTFILAGGTVVADGGTRTIPNPVSVTGNATIGASLDGTPRALTFTGATSLAVNTTLTVSNSAATTFSNVVSGAGGILKTGIGTLTLSNANTFTGGLTLNGGTLAVRDESSLGGPTNVVTFNAGQLLFTGSATTARTFNLSNAVTLTPAAGTTLTYTAGASVSGGFLSAGGTHAFTGGSTLNGSATAFGSIVTTSGAVSFTNATLRGATTQTGGTLTATNTVVSSAGTLTVNGTVNTSSFESNGVLTINIGGTVANTGTPLVLGGGSRTFVGTVGTPGGTLSTATGTSIELNGGLLVNNGVQSGALNVNFGGLAKGAGTFGTVAVGDGGKFSPGNSPGTATVSSLSLGNGGRYDFELNSANATPGNGADFLNVLGNLNVAAGTTPNSVFTIAIISLNGSNQPAALGNFNPLQSYTFTLAAAGGGITGFSANEFAVDTSGFGNSLQGGSFAVLQAGNDLRLQFTPVPEPAASLAVLLGGVALSGWLRRRSRGARLNVGSSLAEPIADIS